MQTEQHQAMEHLLESVPVITAIIGVFQREHAMYVALFQTRLRGVGYTQLLLFVMQILQLLELKIRLQTKFQCV